MTDFKNLYLILIICSLLFLGGKKLFIKDKKEHFIGPIVGPLSAVANFVTNFPDMFLIFVDAIISFFFGLIDIFLSLVDILAWIINVVPWAIQGAFFILTLFSDILTLIILWLNPITAIKGIMKMIFFILKLIIVFFIDIIKNIVSYFLEKFLANIRGGLWGLPHGPEQHVMHRKSRLGGKDLPISHMDLGLYGHHHDHGDNESELYENEKIYKPMRCYKGLGANGYINLIAMIVCPPLGVFMSYGIKGIVKILLCAGLTLFYYFPGLIYGLLITTHLGLGKDIYESDCGGEYGGIMTTGCDKRVNEQDCNEAFFPDKKDANGNKIRACYWNKKQKYCENLHYRQDEYNAIVNKRFDQKQWDKDHKLEETQDTGQPKYTFKPDKSTKDEGVAISTSYNLNKIDLYDEHLGAFGGYEEVGITIGEGLQSAGKTIIDEDTYTEDIGGKQIAEEKKN